MENAVIVERVLNLIVLILSLTFHEFFHAWSAWRLGDDTAARMGRLTLNPIPHVGLFGTILLPLMNAPVGWAKPTPVVPSRFRRGVTMSTGDIIVSAAGPLSNLLLGLVAALRLSGLEGEAKTVADVLHPEPVHVDRDAAWAALALDKKASRGKPRLVLLDAPGEPRWGVEVDEPELRSALDSLIA